MRLPNASEKKSSRFNAEIADSDVLPTLSNRYPALRPVSYEHYNIPVLVPRIVANDNCHGSEAEGSHGEFKVLSSQL
jgi:hypothetical protein